jgi:hypothetical protein
MNLAKSFTNAQISKTEMKKIIGGDMLERCLQNANNAAYHTDNGLSSMEDKDALFNNIADSCVENFG